MKTGDQKEIARDVADARDGDGHQRRVGIAEPAHDAAQHIVGDDHQGAGAADRDVAARLAESFRGSVHERCKLSGTQRDQDSEQESCAKKQNDAGSDDLAAGFCIALAQLLPEQNGGAHGERTDEPSHCVHDLRADRDAGNILRQGKFTHDHQVDGAVQRL